MEPLRRPSHNDHEVEGLKREEMDLHGNDLGTLGHLAGEGPWVDKLSTLGATLSELACLDEISEFDLQPIEVELAQLRQVFTATKE